MNENAQDESTVTGKALGNVALVAGSAAAIAFAGVMGVKGARSAENKIFKMRMSDAQKGAFHEMQQTMKGKSDADILDIIKQDAKLQKEGPKIQKEAEAYRKDEHVHGSKKINDEIDAENKRVVDEEARKAANEANAQDKNPGDIAGTYEGEDKTPHRKVRRDRFKNKGTGSTKTGYTPNGKEKLDGPTLNGGNQTDYANISNKHFDTGYNQEDIITQGHERHEQGKKDRRKQRSEERKQKKEDDKKEFENNRKNFYDDINTNYSHPSIFNGRTDVDYTKIPRIHTGYSPGFDK